MKKIRVLHFPMRNAAGGITQYVLNNWGFIDKSRFIFDFATLSKSFDFEGDLAAQGCKVHYISCTAEENERQFAAEFEAILSEGYDAVHLHTSYWKSFTCEEVARKVNIPVIIVHSHCTGVDVITGAASREEAMELHQERRLHFDLSLATHLCACSRAAADWLFGPQIPREKIRILNNAIDLERFAYNPHIREIYRRELGLENNFVIGHVGRFEYVKNHEFLIDVFAETSKSVPNAKLMLVGVGTRLDAVKVKVEQLGISDKVLFLGRRGDVADLYQAMDLFVLPSRFEGFAIALIEAQTSGLKCISSPAALPENPVTDNIFSLPFDVILWRDAITDIARNGYERSDRSAEVSDAGHSIKEQIKILEKIYLGEMV